MPRFILEDAKEKVNKNVMESPSDIKSCRWGFHSKNEQRLSSIAVGKAL